MITQAELMALALKLKETGMQVEVDPEELEAYFPNVDDDFYLPKVPKNFYYDAEGLRRAGKVKDLKSLTTVNSAVFRKLLGI